MGVWGLSRPRPTPPSQDGPPHPPIGKADWPPRRCGGIYVGAPVAVTVPAAARARCHSCRVPPPLHTPSSGERGCNPPHPRFVGGWRWWSPPVGDALERRLCARARRRRPPAARTRGQGGWPHAMPPYWVAVVDSLFNPIPSARGLLHTHTPPSATSRRGCPLPPPRPSPPPSANAADDFFFPRVGAPVTPKAAHARRRPHASCQMRVPRASNDESWCRSPTGAPSPRVPLLTTALLPVLCLGEAVPPRQ